MKSEASIFIEFEDIGKSTESKLTQRLDLWLSNELPDLSRFCPPTFTSSIQG